VLWRTWSWQNQFRGHGKFGPAGNSIKYLQTKVCFWLVLLIFHKREVVYQAKDAVSCFRSPFYNISIIGAMVGSKSISTKFNAIVDTGTSFTALSDPMYTEITNSVSFVCLY
jgi:hypothetical protein